MKGLTILTLRQYRGRYPESDINKYCDHFLDEEGKHILSKRKARAFEICTLPTVKVVLEGNKKIFLCEKGYTELRKINLAKTIKELNHMEESK